MRYQIFRTDGTHETCEADLPSDPGYDRLKKLLDPILEGPLERVAVLFDGAKRDMFVHEHGAVIGLPRNEAATKIYRTNGLRHEPDRDPESMPAIHGTAVLFPGAQVWF